MRIKRIKRFNLLVFIMLLIIPSIIFAQAQQAQQTQQQEKKTETVTKSHPRDAFEPAVRPEENYLARFKAIEVSERLIKENLENIYMLKVIVSNFKEQGWDKDYQAIYDSYKKGVSLYYRRHVVYSRVELEKNKKTISDLFKKIVDLYNKQTDDMLTQCADKILNFSLDEKSKIDPNRNKVLFQNMMRLWIAYGQVDDASRSVIDGINKNAVYHLRIAKSYAIKILEELDPVGSKGKYNLHKADNLNRIQSPETATKPSSQKQQSTPQ